MDRARLRTYVRLTIAFVIVSVALPKAVQGPLYVAYGAYTATLLFRRVGTLPDEVAKVLRPAAVGVSLAIGGIFVRSLHEVVSGVENPFPSPADALHLLSYATFGVTILRVVHRRVQRLTLDPILDAGVAGIAAALLQMTLVLLPYLRLEDVGTGALVVNLLYNVLTWTLVLAAVLALVAGSTPSPSNRLFAAALVMIYASETVATLVSAGVVPTEVQIAMSPIALILGTVGMLHPSVVHITLPPSGPDLNRRLSRRRVSVLTLALLTPPVLMLATSVWSNGDGWKLLPAGASLALTPLVLTRLARLVRQNEDMAALEATLRGVGERLVLAESPGDVVNVISAGAEQVLGKGVVAADLVLVPVTSDAERRSGGLLPLVHEALERIPESSRVVTGALIDLPAPADQHWTAGPIVVQRELHGLLALVTSRPLRDEERNAVTTLCREAAIALRAVEHTEQQVRQRSEDRFAALIDNSSDIVAILDASRSISYVSPVVQRLLGYSPSEFTGLPAIDLVHPDDREVALRMLEDVRYGLSETSVVRLRHTDGSYRWFEMVGVDLTSDPNIGGIVLNAREITDRKRAEERLTLSEARFKALVQHSTDLVIVFDRDQRVRYASPSVSTVLGAAPDEVQGRHASEVFPESDIDWPTLLEHTATTAGGQELVEFTFRNASDQWRTVETTVTDLLGEPAVEGFVLNARDITDRKNMEQRLRYQATHDELTGLANRVHVLDDLTGMLDRNSGSTTVAAILIGIDDFKEINDSLGHAAGDELLIAVAGRITGMLGFGDIAARVGGDEFVVVLERGHGETHITDLAEQILTAIASPYVVDGRELTITASAGIVFDHDRSSSAEIMLRNADIAMYRAKTQGKRQIVVFETHMHTDSFDRLQLRADLARAVDLEQFVAHYQPVIEIATRRIVGAEALIRWQHPERGLLGPNVFIPLAEETGLIGALGEWILDRACRDLVAWREAFPAAADFTMSVNLSVQQLHDPGIVNTVEDTLVRTGLPADRLVLEVTESTLITDTERIRATMEELRRLGARLAVDDFGTGYSSLGYIQQFEFDVLKIDKSFVDALETHTNRRIITAVIELARQLEVRTIAEGIESELQANLLEDLGCAYGQGYLFSRPVPAEAFTELLADERTRSTGHARI